MSRLRILICQVDDEAEPDRMRELHRFDLPSVDVEQMKPETALDGLEDRTLDYGRQIMRHLLEQQWREVDGLLVDKYRRSFPP